MENTLLYNFSTIAQVLATITALTGIFLFYRIETINNLLIGQGIAIYKGQQIKIKNKVTDRPLLDSIRLNRLSDSIDRKNIYGIEEIILNLTNQEFTIGVTEKGYVNNIYKNFRKTKIFLNIIKIGTLLNLIILIFLLILNVLNINQVQDLLTKSLEYQNYVLRTNTILFVISLILTIIFIGYISLFRAGFEKTKMKENKKLKKFYKINWKNYH